MYWLPIFIAFLLAGFAGYCIRMLVEDPICPNCGIDIHALDNDDDVGF